MMNDGDLYNNEHVNDMQNIDMNNDTVLENNSEVNDEYSNKYSLKENKFLENTIDYISLAFYVILIGSVFVRFIPIVDGNWFTIGMGKLVLLSSIFGIFAILKKNYFAAFFISLFSLFFVFHEIIIFYDDYAIKLGKELNPGGVFRSVIELYRDAFSAKCGAFWALVGSGLSLIFGCISWLKYVVSENMKLSKDNTRKVIA